MPIDHLPINTMVDSERDDRRRVFERVIEELSVIDQRLASMPTHVAFVVPDTNFFLHQELYFDEVDWSTISNELDEFRVMIPMAVVRELDKAKRAQPGKKVSDRNDESARTRARVTSRRIRGMFKYVGDTHKLGSRSGMELLLDPRGHRHLDDADTEIIERALALKALSGKDVFIAKDDGGMQFMAEVAHLKVIAIPD